MNELTWKDIPWANMEQPVAIPEGTEAIIPEIDAHGQTTGNYMRLNHEKYMRVMGATAYVQLRGSGNPEEIHGKLQNKPHRIVSTDDQLVPNAPLEIYERMDK